eukprot:7378743-Prymnesium_polylepis.1
MQQLLCLVACDQLTERSGVVVRRLPNDAERAVAREERQLAHERAEELREGRVACVLAKEERDQEAPLDGHQRRLEGVVGALQAQHDALLGNLRREPRLAAA